MIPLWSEGKDSFAKEPPNATLSAFTSDGKVANGGGAEEPRPER